jgi:photosystem II stability/assembly factor-like uncharacterized protein
MRMSPGRATAVAAVPLLLIALGAGSASAQPASGNPPPPKVFEVGSASFVSAQAGFVLGTRHCSRLPCKALLEQTVNGGKAWTSVTVPAVQLVQPFSSSPSSAVDTVRFENASDGWLFGPGLWATTTGGKHWQRESLPGDVIELAASDGEAFAVTEPAEGGLNQARLYRSEVGTTSWTLVHGVYPANALTVFGHSVWAGIAPALWTSTDSGEHWTKLRFNCPSDAITATPVAAASTKNVAIACSDQSFPLPGSSVKKVYASSNGGRSFHLVGWPPEAGNVGTVAMPPGRPRLITVTATSGASYLYRSANGGKSWGTTELLDGGLGFRDLAFVSATTGYLVHFNSIPIIAYSLGLMKTVNAGRHWTKVAIP